RNRRVPDGAPEVGGPADPQAGARGARRRHLRQSRFGACVGDGKAARPVRIPVHGRAASDREGNRVAAQSGRRLLIAIAYRPLFEVRAGGCSVLNSAGSTASAIALYPASLGCRWSHESNAARRFLGSFGSSVAL